MSSFAPSPTGRHPVSQARCVSWGAGGGALAGCLVLHVGGVGLSLLDGEALGGR